MRISFRRAAGAPDCHFIHGLILSEVPNGHFDSKLLDPRASAGLMQNVQRMVQKGRHIDTAKNDVPAQIVVVEADGEIAGFGVTTVLDLGDTKINELWLAGVAPGRRRRGVMTALVAFYCKQWDSSGIPVAARLLPASQGMRIVLTNQGFKTWETQPSGHAFLIRGAMGAAEP